MNQYNSILPREAVTAIIDYIDGIRKFLSGKSRVFNIKHGKQSYQVVSFTHDVFVFKTAPEYVRIGIYKKDDFISTVEMLNAGYQVQDIKEQRETEIKVGLNYATRDPLYVVYSIVSTVHEADTDYTACTTHSSKGPVYGFYHKDCDMFIHESDTHNFNMVKTAMDEEWENVLLEFGEEEGEEYSVDDFIHLVELYHDRFESAFFTRKAAEQFIETNGHNMNEPYIYVESIERRNFEFNDLLK